ncbi:hypothetical protein BGX34_005178 [Mortierella sp. NVP85]|nr:hypothetical protein BGX34_005178 [Mortierella sp. NVP85]
MAPSWPSFGIVSSYFAAITAWGNDHDQMNAQIHQQHPRQSPTHVSVLGDLFSSQWIGDQEFDIRLARYRSIFQDPAVISQRAPSLLRLFSKDILNSHPVLINVTGNHDIGYGNDISQARLDRWERVFGKSNFISLVDIPNTIPSIGDGDSSNTPGSRLHLVVLNTMLLDGPASDENLRNQTWQFIEDAAGIKDRHPRDKIVLLTHIPFHKEKGICVDEPDTRLHWDNTILEQTMLSPNSSHWILDHLRPDFVLNGHDHFGCDVTHVKDRVEPQDDQPNEFPTEVAWKTYATSSLPMQDAEKRRGQSAVREITQRSMMAEYGGYSGLLEARVVASPMRESHGQDQGPPEVEFHYTACAFYRDLLVWVVIVVDAIVIGAWALVVLYKVVMFIVTRSSNRPVQAATSDKKLKTL